MPCRRTEGGLSANKSGGMGSGVKPTQTMPAACLLAGLIVMNLPSCAFIEGLGESPESRKNRQLRDSESARHALFRGLPNWKENTFRSEELLALANPENTSIHISLDEQRGFLLVDNTIAVDFPVATGKRSHPTPAGSYTILDKQVAYASNLYGKIYDAEGTVINSDADSRTDTVPEGGKFEGASMPYWMRLTQSGIGLHVGYVPGRPASHGCIRMKADTAKTLFKVTRLGTPVLIAKHPPAPLSET
jgi:hypothetical protein